MINYLQIFLHIQSDVKIIINGGIFQNSEFNAKLE